MSLRQMTFDVGGDGVGGAGRTNGNRVEEAVYQLTQTIKLTPGGH